MKCNQKTKVNSAIFNILTRNIHKLSAKEKEDLALSAIINHYNL